MSLSSDTEQRATATAPSAPSTIRGRGGMAVPATASFGFAFLLLMTTGVMNDVQGVALQPMVGVMAADLSLSPSQTSWALNAQSIAAIIAVSTTARLADIFGHKRLLVPLMFIGTLGSVLAALASSFVMIAAGRALIGFAIASPMAWALVKARSDGKGMQKAALWSGTVVAFCTPLALVLGGVMLEIGAKWTSIFWIIAVLHAVMFGLALLIKETPASSRSNVPPDWAGAFLLAGALVCLLLALSQGRTWGWGSAAVIGLFVAAVVVFALFVGQQRAVRHPMMDFRGMEIRQMTCGYLAFGAIAVLASTCYILVPMIGQAPEASGYGFGMGVLESSLPLLMILPTTFLASATSKPMLERYGPRPPMVLGGTIATVSLIWMAFMHAEPWQLFVGMTLFGYGVVIPFNLGYALVAASGRQNNMSLTFGMQYAASAPFGALAVAIMFVVLSSSSTVIPGTEIAVASEGTFTANFLWMAGAAFALYVVQGLVFAPRRLNQHEIVLDTPGTAAATPEEILTVPTDDDTAGDTGPRRFRR
jgi:MFS family permease